MAAMICCIGINYKFKYALNVSTLVSPWPCQTVKQDVARLEKKVSDYFYANDFFHFSQ